MAMNTNEKDYVPFNLENLKLLRQRLLDLQIEKTISPYSLAKRLGWHDDEAKKKKIYRFLKRPVENINHFENEEYQTIAKELLETELWEVETVFDHSSKKPDQLWFALNSFLNVPAGSKLNMGNRAPGIFRVYRHSVLRKNKYIIGFCRIEQNPKTKALIVEERFKLKERTKEGKISKISFRPLAENYKGYMTRRNKYYYIITHDQTASRLQFSVLPYVRMEDNEVNVLMYGLVLGLLDGRIYCSRIVYERLEPEMEEAALEEVNVYDEGDISPVVLTYLKGNEGDFSLISF
jgi:hypothetical protein